MAILVIVMVFAVGLFTTRREGFTLHERDCKLCRPFLNGRDAKLMPTSIVLVVQGYNYSETPKVFRDGKHITPLQYAWDYGNMTYYFVVHAPKCMCGSDWILETSDFVEPTVYEGRSGERLTVSLERRRNGYHKWNIGCCL